MSSQQKAEILVFIIMEYKHMNTPFMTKEYNVTSVYGKRTLNGVTDIHKGLDLVCKNPIVTATEDGVIHSSCIITDKSNRTWEWGNYVCLKTDSGLYIYYCHLDSRTAKKGDRVNKGDDIGIMGNTGYSFGKHLHFEVRKNGTAINAADYLEIENKVGKAKEIRMTREEILQELGDEYIRTFDELPEWAKPDMRELLDNGIVNGGTSASENPDDINMFLSDIKTLIVCKRLK